MMRTYRGIVCEQKNKYTVFLTDKGDFLRGIPIGRTPDIGDEVDFHPVFTPALLSRKVKPRFVGAVMLAAVLLISIVASLMPMNDRVMAYVQLETSMALELGVNQTGKVITLRYLNDTNDEPGNRFADLKNYPIGEVLDTAVKELSAGHNDMLVNITIIFQNVKSQEKVQGIVGSAVREVRRANKELTLEIGESTAEERVMANQHEMSVHKFKGSQQVSPMNEKKSSPEVDHDKKPNLGNQQSDKDAPEQSDKQKGPSVPPSEKKSGNGNPKDSNEHKKPILSKPDANPNKERDEKLKHTPAEKWNPSNPEPENENVKKGNQNSVSQQHKENQNQQKRPGTANGHGNQVPQKAENGEK